MKKFEYKVITIPTEMTITTKQYEKTALEFEKELNKLGEETGEIKQRMIKELDKLVD